MKPDWLLENDVVVVTFNYRLGPLGFLCLDIPEAPGNAGLKDQVNFDESLKVNLDQSNIIIIFIIQCYTYLFVPCIDIGKHKSILNIEYVLFGLYLGDRLGIN